MIAKLTWYADNLITWQSEAIAAWRSMVEAMAVFNQVHLNQQIMVHDHYPELFEYLAVQPDMVLMMERSWS